MELGRKILHSIALLLTLIVLSLAQENSTFLKKLTCFSAKEGVSVSNVLEEQRNFCTGGDEPGSSRSILSHLQCTNACIMSLWGLVFEWDPASQTLRDEIQGIHNGRDKYMRLFLAENFEPDVAKRLGDWVIDQCVEIMHLVIHQLKDSCDKWSLVYNCIDRAWSCEDEKGSTN